MGPMKDFVGGRERERARVLSGTVQFLNSSSPSRDNHWHQRKLAISSIPFTLPLNPTHPHKSKSSSKDSTSAPISREVSLQKQTEPKIPFPPHLARTKSSTSDLAPHRPGFDPTVRNTSTSIFYLLTPHGPQGGFHRNKGRTVHTLHRGRGRYVLIHANEEGTPKRIETFIVGQNVAAGERLQWIVDGGKYKASYLLPDEDGGEDSQGLLISETVVPGF
ncbi:hypothetical protein EYC84_001092 [Monilinia fructicola]|uniref:DUF985 domain-containing protein n=1 Tax=Monilinia fructicola TaxID=38448 RepID=A0A5M9JJK3_MONFR|nr:hypothetical protein EYC84_001092 [Monilinia fructicola]